MAVSPKFKRRLRDLERWVERVGTQAELDQNEKEIETALKNQKKGARHTSVQVQFIGYFHMMHAQHAIMAGDAAGWRRLDRATSYQLLSMFIHCPPAQESSALLSLAFAIGRDLDGTRLAQTVLQHPKADFVRAWDTSHYPLFAFRLWSLVTGVGADLPPLPLNNAYGELERQLLSPAPIAALLEAAAERHVVEASDSESVFTDFLSMGELPVEVLWIERIRRERGLPNAEVAHPMCQTALAKPPPLDQFPRFDLSQDELYQKVREAAVREGIIAP